MGKKGGLGARPLMAITCQHRLPWQLYCGALRQEKEGEEGAEAVDIIEKETFTKQLLVATALWPGKKKGCQEKE